MPALTAAALASAALFCQDLHAALPQDLRDEAIGLHARVLAVESSRTNPDDGVILFAGSRVPDLRLRHVYVRVDGGALFHHEYNDREGRALASGGLDRLAALSLAPGEHRLRIEIIARHVQDKPGEARIRQRLDLAITKPPGPWRASLEVLDLGLTGNAQVGLHEWPTLPTPADDDPDVRSAAYLADAGRPLEARIAVAQLQIQAPGFGVPERLRLALASTEQPDPAGVAALNEAVRQLSSPSASAQALTDFLASPTCEVTDNDACDRARLLLGYHALRSGEGESAAAAFRAVHVPGPYATRALLGLGWALLAPRRGRDDVAALAPVAYTPDVAARRRARLALPPPGDERTKALLAALVPWNDLVGRDPLDAASQEGLLAIAWALDTLGAHEQAAGRWLTAAQQLDEVRGQLDVALAQAADGRLAASVTRSPGEAEDGWERTLAPVAHADPTRTLRHLLVDTETSAAVDDLREVHALAMLLDDDAQRLGRTGDPDSLDLAARLGAVHARLAGAESAQQARLSTAAHAALVRLKEQTEGYLAEARFALARIYDRSVEQEIP